MESGKEFVDDGEDGCGCGVENEFGFLVFFFFFLALFVGFLKPLVP